MTLAHKRHQLSWPRWLRETFRLDTRALKFVQRNTQPSNMSLARQIRQQLNFAHRRAQHPPTRDLAGDMRCLIAHPHAGRRVRRHARSRVRRSIRRNLSRGCLKHRGRPSIAVCSQLFASLERRSGEIPDGCVYKARYSSERRGLSPGHHPVRFDEFPGQRMDGPPLCAPFTLLPPPL